MSISCAKVPAALNAFLAVAAVNAAVLVLGNNGMYPWGIDSMQLYGAAELVNRGEAARLYDETYFQQRQRLLAGAGDDCTLHYYLYPPFVALALSPWARLPYPAAQAFWKAMEGLGLAAFGWMVCRGMGFPRPWRVTVVLAVATMMPLWMAVRVGQLTFVWLLAILGGFLLHRRQRPWLAGLAFSLLAMKPPLAAPLVIWLVMRRDGRTLAGMLAGVAAQMLLVMACLGLDMPFYYLRELPRLTLDAKVADFPAAYEQSIAGTAKNVLRQMGLLGPRYLRAILLIQLAAAIAAGLALYRVVRQNRGDCSTGFSRNFAEIPAKTGTTSVYAEYAAVVLFMALASPHLLLYDAGILAVAVTCLWLTSDWRMGVVLLFSLTVIAEIGYVHLGVSLMPCVALLVLLRLAFGLQSGNTELAATPEISACHA